MKKYLILFLITALMFGFEDLNLKKIHRDEDVDYTYNVRFNVESSLKWIDAISEFLNNFRILTEKVKKSDKSLLENIKHTGWEQQNLGFTNLPIAIKGTLLKQDYLLKKLEYEIAVLKKSKDVDQFKIKYDLAKEEFVKFWNSTGISD